MSTAIWFGGNLPGWLSFVLDEAYGSCGGMHFCPFSQHQLKKAFETSKELYFKMRTFNHCLSSLRITIERAFGQLVRRWGILWCCNGVRLRRVALMVTVCAKVMNTYNYIKW